MLSSTTEEAMIPTQINPPIHLNLLFNAMDQTTTWEEVTTPDRAETKDSMSTRREATTNTICSAWWMNHGTGAVNLANAEAAAQPISALPRKNPE